MSSGFKFPPPPPPPPKTDSQLSYSPNNSNFASSRGDRGRGRGSRGFRGSRGSQGSFRGSNQNSLPFNNHLKRKHDATGYSSTGSGHFQQNGSTFESTGANSGVLGQSTSPPRIRKPKVEVAPAVPSFGFSLPTPVFPDHSTSGSQILTKSTGRGSLRTLAPAKRKTNQLGLTPSGEDRESSEDDADEEATLASDGPRTGSALQFEYRGQQMSLGTAGDLAAWIAERKKRFPTRARVEEKKAEATRKAKERAESQVKANEARRGAKKVVGLDVDKDEGKKGGKDERKLQRAMERHLEKAQRLQEKIRRHEEAAIGTGSTGIEAVFSSQPGGTEGKATTDVAESNDMKDSSSELSTSSEETSTDESDSISDTTSDDEFVDEKVSKKSHREVTAQREQQQCSFYARHGHCKYGTECRFKHEGPGQPGGQGEKREPKADLRRETRQSQKLNLHQRLVEQQRAQENKLVLEAVRFLDSQGYFERFAQEPPHKINT